MLLAVILVSASAGQVPASLTQLRTGVDADSQMLSAADRGFLSHWHAAQERNRKHHAWRAAKKPIGKTWVIGKKTKGRKKESEGPGEEELKFHDKLHDLAAVVKETQKQGHDLAAVNRGQSRALKQWKRSKWRAEKGEMLAEAAEEHREGWERAEEAAHEMQAWQRAGEADIKREEAALEKQAGKGGGKYPPKGPASLVEFGKDRFDALDENGVPDPRSPDFDPLGGVLDSLDAMQAHFDQLERHSPVHKLRLWAQDHQRQALAEGGGIYRARPRHRHLASKKEKASLTRMVRLARRKRQMEEKESGKATSFLEEQSRHPRHRHRAHSVSRFHDEMNSYLEKEEHAPRGNPYLAEMYGAHELRPREPEEVEPREDAATAKAAAKDAAKESFHREAQAFHHFEQEMAANAAKAKAGIKHDQAMWKKVYRDAHLQPPAWLDAPLPVHDNRLAAKPRMPKML